MKERPILMSAPMVRACFNNTKRQTRRIVKHEFVTSQTTDIQLAYNNDWVQADWNGANNIGPCPYGFPGDRLWVRETFAPNAVGSAIAEVLKAKPQPRYYYQATHEGAVAWRWRPSIHMPRAASRLTLELTRVRAERLHDITEADAWAEGIGREVGRERPLEALFNVCMAFPKLNIGALAADDPTLFTFGDDRSTPTDYERVVATTGRGVYAALWEGINGPGSWAANPWVWALDFRRVQP